MRQNQFRLRAVMALSLLMLWLLPGTSAQEGHRLTISGPDPRPLADAIQTLEKRHGWIVTYEDPVYVHADDVAGIAASVRKNGPPSTPRVLLPVGGTFEFSYTIRRDALDTDVAAILQRLINEYNLKGPRGRFRLTPTGNVFHVVPSDFKDATGAYQVRGSLLDAKISLHRHERSVYEMFRAIVSALPAPAGTHIGIGMFPMNLFLQVRVHDGADDETARYVLMRTLQATNRKLSWQLLCGAAARRTCALNITSVP